MGAKKAKDPVGELALMQTGIGNSLLVDDFLQAQSAMARVGTLSCSFSWAKPGSLYEYASRHLEIRFI